jgi:very-short-patch-repair endonuclease
VIDLPDPDWYLDNVLVHAQPDVDALRTGPVADWRAWWQSQVNTADPLMALASTQGFVVTTAQLREAGWADPDLRREVRRGTWWVPGHGTASPVVIAGDDFLARRRHHAFRAAAAALVRIEHIVSGVSGAVLHGLPTMDLPSLPLLTSLRDDWLGRRAASHVRHAGITAAQIDSWYGTPLTNLARTVVDLARHDRRSAIMAADAALRERLVTLRELQAALTVARGWPGIRQAREIVKLADGEAESPLESIVRLALHDDGFPPPRLQQVVAGYRVDFLWPERRLILEADGRLKYSDDVLWEEKKRETVLRRAGYDVERVLWSDMFAEWPAMSRHLRALLRR